MVTIGTHHGSKQHRDSIEVRMTMCPAKVSDSTRLTREVDTKQKLARKLVLTCGELF